MMMTFAVAVAFVAGMALAAWRASGGPLDVEDIRVRVVGAGAVEVSFTEHGAFRRSASVALHPVLAHALSSDLLRASASARRRVEHDQPAASGAGE